MTRNLKAYLVFSIIWSVLFFAVLGWGIANSAERWPYILLAAVTYGGGFGLVGYYFGKRDDQSRVRYSLGDAYGATSNLTSAVIGSIWIVLFRPGDAWTVAIYLLLMAVVAVLGLIKYRKSIKGMKNTELFQ